MGLFRKEKHFLEKEDEKIVFKNDEVALIRTLDYLDYWFNVIIDITKPIDPTTFNGYIFYINDSDKSSWFSHHSDDYNNGKYIIMDYNNCYKILASNKKFIYSGVIDLKKVDYINIPEISNKSELNLLLRKLKLKKIRDGNI